MKDLLKISEYIGAYADAITNGADKLVRSIPIFTKQQLKAEARKRLNSTYDHYINHTNVKMKEYVLVVELDKEDWLVNALEGGVEPFDMKKRLQNDKRVKVSKQGYRYVSVPIGKNKGDTPGTQKGQEFQKRIEEVLQYPKFGLKKLKSTMNGGVIESQQILTDDPMLKGFYRFRSYDNKADLQSGHKKPWQMVMFRTMSENPLSRSKWQHPGIQPANILKKVEAWLDQNVDSLLESFIEAEVAAINERLKLEDLK